jgi:hypothetical protein
MLNDQDLTNPHSQGPVMRYLVQLVWIVTFVCFGRHWFLFVDF